MRKGEIYMKYTIRFENAVKTMPSLENAVKSDCLAFNPNDKYVYIVEAFTDYGFNEVSKKEKLIELGSWGELGCNWNEKLCAYKYVRVYHSNTDLVVPTNRYEDVFADI